MIIQQHQMNNMLTHDTFVSIPIVTHVTMTCGNTKVFSLIHIIKKLHHMLKCGINHGQKDFNLVK